MKKENGKWDWEVAYKKWFFIRFSLLLIVLALTIVLAYVTFGISNNLQADYSDISVNQVAEKVDYSGIYKYQNNIIELKKKGDSLYDISSDATRMGRSVDSVSVRKISGEIHIRNGKGVYSREGCIMSILINEQVGLMAQDNMMCGGLNVRFSGYYSK